MKNGFRNICVAFLCGIFLFSCFTACKPGTGTPGSTGETTSNSSSEKYASLTLRAEPYSVLIDGRAIPLYDDYFHAETDMKDFTATIKNENGEETDLGFSGNVCMIERLRPGKYTITYSYRTGNYIKETEISAGENVEVVLSVSPVLLGTEGSASSGWELKDEMQNSVSVTGGTYVLAGTESHTSCYVDGIFDAENCSPERGDACGLMLAQDARAPEKMLIAGIYGDSVYLGMSASLSSVGDNYWPVANLSEIPGLAPFDGSSVRLGVLRDGNEYYFFVNGIFSARYRCNVADFAGAETASRIGVASAGTSRDITIADFNYSFDAELLSELKESVPEAGEIDVYLIAGQSNAAGYSTYNYDTALGEDARFAYGFPGIWYAGNARGEAEGIALNRELEWQLVRIGLGRPEYFGPELGMAAALSSLYNAETGRTAAIVKYAAGGTSLLNKLSGKNAAEGNWVPPSYQAVLGAGDPRTGGLYRNFLAETEKRITELNLLGYTPKIRGLYWMQGEEDMGSPATYKTAFTYFVSDIRRDLGGIVGEDLSELPVYVGQISRTTGGRTDNIPQAFIEMQNTLAELPYVFVIQSGKYLVGTEYDSGCYDDYHWSYRSQLAIGRLVGHAMLEHL